MYIYIYIYKSVHVVAHCTTWLKCPTSTVEQTGSTQSCLVAQADCILIQSFVAICDKSVSYYSIN